MDSGDAPGRTGFFGRLDERRGYHHGRLKEALLEAARGLLSERGGGTFTLAEAAKRVGVTSAALYRHFADRDALLAELSRRAFDLFGQRMAGAWDQGRPDPVSALTRMGSAYLGFAREEPGLYSAMFSDVAALAREPAAGAAAAKAFDQLRGAVAAALLAKGGSAGAASALALQIWSLSHGVASLVAGGHLDPAWAGNEPEAVLRSGVASLLEQTARPTAPTGPWGR
jgi:AcrR family transcriptional regulator